MPILLAAFLLGCVAGLRTLTAPAVLLLMRHPWPFGYVLAVFAVGEYAGDLHPNTPSRTQPVGLIARAVSGAFCGWLLAATTGTSGVAGALAGAIGAILGAYAGLWVRLRSAAAIGRVPAALAEDALAIVGAVLIVAFA